MTPRRKPGAAPGTRLSERIKRAAWSKPLSGTPPAEWARRAILAGASVLVTLLACEAITTLVLWRSEGRLVTLVERMAPEDALQSAHFDPRIDTPSGICRWSDQFQFHPYLGFVYHRIPPCAPPKVNNRGLLGPDIPEERKPGTFVIMLAGGSVAENQFRGNYKSLQDELNEHYVGNGIDRFIVVSGAIAGWKQPLQLIAFSLYAGSLDGVITLDGYNERSVLMSSDANLPEFESPPHPQILGGLSNFMSWRAIYFSYLDRKLNHVERSFPARHSQFAYFLLERLRGKFRALATAPLSDPGASIFAYAADFPPERRVEHNLEQYRRYIRMMDAVALRLGIKRLFLIQPTPRIDKDLTPEERSYLKAEPDYHNDYLRLERSLLGLRSEGVPVFTLTHVFHDVKEQIYFDVIHLNPTGRDRINATILRLLEQYWGLKRTR